jgi:hypothetical protein
MERFASPAQLITPTENSRYLSATIFPEARSCFTFYISFIPDMRPSPASPSAPFLLLYNSALQDYTNQTKTNLVDHQFAKQLEKCESVDSISSLLGEQLKRFHEFRREDEKILKPLKCAIHVLQTLSTSTVLGEGIGLVGPKGVSLFHISNVCSIAIPTCEGSICCIWHLARGSHLPLIQISL